MFLIFQMLFLIHLVSVIKSAARHVRLTKLGWLTENSIDLSSSHMLFEKPSGFFRLYSRSGKHGRLGHVIEQEICHAVAHWQVYILYGF